MPKTVKAFVWLSALYVLFGASLLAWYLTYTLPQWGEATAGMPVAAHESTLRALFQGAWQTFVLHTAIFATLAGLASFARQNWARWLLAAYFLLVLLKPFVSPLLLYATAPKMFSLAFGSPESWFRQYLYWTWQRPAENWPAYVDTGTKIVLLILIFSPASRPWFRREPS